MNAPMTNLQIYLTVGVLGLTLLIVIGLCWIFCTTKRCWLGLISATQC
jgi:hypothetical protein